VFVIADNINVSARLTTDFFIKKTGSASFMPPNQKQPNPLKKFLRSMFSLLFVSATPPSVSALTLLPKKSQFLEYSGVLFGVGILQLRRPNYAPTLKKGQVDVFSIMFVSADNISVSVRQTTDLFIKNWVGQLHAAEPKAA